MKQETIEKLKAVLCDADGNVCISGSDEDRRVIQEILAELEQEQIDCQKPADNALEFIKRARKLFNKSDKCQEDEYGLQACDIIDRQAKEVERQDRIITALQENKTDTSIQLGLRDNEIASLKKERDALYNWVYGYLSEICPDYKSNDCKNNSNCKECSKITKMVQDVMTRGR